MYHPFPVPRETFLYAYLASVWFDEQRRRWQLPSFFAFRHF